MILMGKREECVCVLGGGGVSDFSSVEKRIF